MTPRTQVKDLRPGHEIKVKIVNKVEFCPVDKVTDNGNDTVTVFFHTESGKRDSFTLENYQYVETKS